MNQLQSVHTSPPKTSYSKYRCQSKTNALLNKLNNDSGYPQDIVNESKYQHKNQPNYLIKNTKNLKNFFKDRLPNATSKPTSLNNNKHIDPSRILQMKKNMYDLKNKTRMSLTNSFEINKYPVQVNFNKVKEKFNLNDKNQEFKRTFLGDQPKYKSDNQYTKDHFRRGTKSYTQKISRICKKKAYDSVFGPDISSISSTFHSFFHQKNKTQINQQIKTQKVGLRCQQSAEMVNKRQQFSMLIDKMQSYKDQLNISSYETQKQSRKLRLAKNSLNPENDSKMITLIKNIAQDYKQKSIDQYRTAIHKVEDIEKINPQFYQKMQIHKTNRLNRKILNIQNSGIVQSPKFSRLHLPNDEQTTLQISLTVDYCSDDNIQQDQQMQKKKKYITPWQKFKLFGRQLCNAVANAQIYGIRRDYFYQAFWKIYTPFEMQGSYAFFKTIKNGDVNAMKLFLQKQLQYLYQVDSKYRTTLTYACVHNQTQVVRFILQCGIDIDKKCSHKKTPVFYALQHGNVEIVKMLLQKGASPWSTPTCPYNHILKKHNCQYLEQLMQNAKKIFLAVRLQQTSKSKNKFWLANKHRINQKEDIIF